MPKAASRPSARRTCRTLGPRGESCSSRCAIFGAGSCSLREGRQCPVFGRHRTCCRLSGPSVRWRPAHGQGARERRAEDFVVSCCSRRTSTAAMPRSPLAALVRAVRPMAASGRPHRLARKARLASSESQALSRQSRLGARSGPRLAAAAQVVSILAMGAIPGIATLWPNPSIERTF